MTLRPFTNSGFNEFVYLWYHESSPGGRYLTPFSEKMPGTKYGLLFLYFFISHVRHFPQVQTTQRSHKSRVALTDSGARIYFRWIPDVIQFNTIEEAVYREMRNDV